MDVPHSNWQNVSVRACEHVAATLSDMMRSDVCLQMPTLPDEAFRFMDLAAVVQAQDRYWRVYRPVSYSTADRRSKPGPTRAV